ncbi:alpha-galactosidase [Kribbella sp. NBC_01245]|uniref:glycoside hydrolase family 36 protein n=1 Tax=Kribbella sp. NBC_01245 TaxID=2903578 RepID=UPI002E2E83F3|nr:glycoside hydrolase family 36 protein [Kribbella sp. NBC_01245]
MNVPIFQWGNDGLRLHIAHGEHEPPRLLALTIPGDQDPDPGTLLRSALPVVEVALAGGGRHGTSGKRHVDGLAGLGLRLVTWQQHVDDGVHRLLLDLADRDHGLEVKVHYSIANGVPALHTWAEVSATTGSVVLDYVSSFTLSGLGQDRRWEDELALWQAANPWSGEFRWRSASLAELGLYDVGMVAYDQTGSKNRIAVTSTGSWSTSERLPMGLLEDQRTGRLLGWQIEHNGAWHYELGDRYDAVYLTASGPTAAEHQWSQRLEPGETFRTVPATVVLGNDLEGVVAALTAHRRRIRRPHADTTQAPIIYNDFLNGLMADPTTERELPLIEAAAELGAEVFCIDAGWYDDEGGGWWDAVGEWTPSVNRFPDGGLGALINRIRAAGLRPGLWLEPEVVGVRSPIARSLPDAAFFQRDGQRLTEWGRHQLDLRHPAAKAHLDGVVDRLMAEFGLAYLKLDYNIDIGAGTDVGGSIGAGLLEHNRAYLAWVSELMDRHPGLTVEGCSAGGSRTDGASGAVFPIQSLTDQQNFRLMPPIVAASPLAITPEQAGVWASVDGSMSDEELAFSLITSLLFRVHLAGRIDTLSTAQRAVVREALSTYRELRSTVSTGTPWWPLGLPAWRDEWIAVGRRTGDELLLAVWRRDGDAKLTLPLDAAREVEVLYPRWGGEIVDVVTNARGEHALEIALPASHSARLLRLY